MSEKRSFYKDYVPVSITSILFIAQIVIGVHLLSEITQIAIIAYAGVTLYILAGIIFGLLPVIEFRRKGEVPTGDSYIHTTTLVNTGIYSIVRHPQYNTFILWAIAGMLLFQHWIIILIGIPIIPLTYIDLLKADIDAIEKFGDVYNRYMNRVPRMNFLLGAIRQLGRRDNDG